MPKPGKSGRNIVEMPTDNGSEQTANANAPVEAEKVIRSASLKDLISSLRSEFLFELRSAMSTLQTSLSSQAQRSGTLKRHLTTQMAV